MDGYVFEETKMRNFAFNQLRSMLFRNPTANEVESYIYKMKVISLQKHKEKFGIKNSELEVVKENTVVKQSPEPVKEPTPSPSPEPVKEPTPSPSPEPVKEPTPSPSPEPVKEPTPSPSPEPVKEPTPSPSPEPFLEPEVNSSSFLQKEECKKNDNDSLSD